ncbi:MAG: cohesin domain-containing protein [Lachnospiraceae bacterium]
MKIIKKIATLLLSVCLVVPCFSMIAQAADGRISFDDPATAVGETVSIGVNLRSNGGAVGDVSMTLSYDASALRFESGDGITAGNEGQIKYTGKGNGSDTLLKFTAKFIVIKEGTSKVEVVEYSAKTNDGESITCKEGNSTVTAKAGDPSKIPEATASTGDAVGNATAEVEVNGAKYTFSDAFSEALIPPGFKTAELTYEGTPHKVVQQEASGIYLGYLIDAEKNGDFFLYQDETATFSPFEQVMISDTTYIILLNDEKAVTLPKTYQKVKLTMNGKEFPAWQDSTQDGYYVVYAVNGDGKKGLYQYDSKEGTYQRYIEKVKTEKAKSNSMFGKLTTILEKNMDKLILGIGLGFLVFLILIIVIAIKLRHRNLELDELYEEYNIDGYNDEPVASNKKDKAIPVSKKENKFEKRYKQEDEDDFDDFEDEYDYEDDDEYADYDDDDGYTDYDEDDLDNPLTGVPTYKNQDDDFKIDFIDLD